MWKNMLMEVPIEGQKIDVWDAIHNFRVTDVTYYEDGSISAYTRWSGSFSFWMPIPGNPHV